MLELSEISQGVLRSSGIHVVTRVESWRGDVLLAEDIPVTGPTETGDRASRVPESLSFVVPRVDNGYDWSPDTEDHPLAANGQRLRVQLGIGTGSGTVEWFTRGWFVVDTAAPDGDAVVVECNGLLQLIDEAELISPFQPTGTFVSTLQDLVEPALSLEFSGSLVDRNVPASVNFDTDRLGNVYQLLDSWPAEINMTAEGFGSIVPVTPTTEPVLSLTSAYGGTIIKTRGESTRQGAFNVVVAEGTAPDGSQVRGTAFDDTSPKRYGGEFNPLAVPFRYFSPLLTTVDQCTAAARTVLARKKREQALAFSVEMVPHYGVQLGDLITVTTEKYDALPCTVEALSLPYDPTVGPMTLTVKAVS